MSWNRTFVLLTVAIGLAAPALADFTPRRTVRARVLRALEPERLRVEVIESYPHDSGAFTQGLVLDDGNLYESTGLFGESSLRRVDLETGAVLDVVDPAPELFGEGLALVGDRLIQLTWLNRKALVYDLALDAEGELDYPTEGWGVCYDGRRLLMTDGTDRLYYRDPATFALRDTVRVKLGGRRLRRLNELECAGNELYANVWLTDTIVEIDKRSGRVRAVIDAAGLLGAEERAGLGPEAVLNGIAYDAETDTFLVTGKLWPKLFRVRFVPE
jgi:glutaminyl-peptide cyclotransferase